MMRAARIVGPGRVEVETVPRPDPREGEVRIDVEACGVCASNLGPWRGLPWIQYPMAPGESGHEAIGIVDAVGPGVTRFREGDRVTGLTYRSYAEYDVTRADHLLPVPRSIDVPIPGEALGCAVNVFRRAGVEAGQTVAVVGVGFLGAILVRLAARAGARVIGLSRRKFAIDVARRMGAGEVVELADHQRAIEAVRELTGGAFCERVFEVAGHQWPLDLASELTKERGRLIIAGYHQDGPRTVNMQLWNWRGIDVINAHERDPARYLSGIEAAMAMIEAGDLDPKELITHTYPLDRIGDALTATADRPEGFLKAMVTP
jgi:threonine dehydrogenase-like Zn-dependent dehydrogenase